MRGSVSLLLALAVLGSVTTALACPMGVACPMQDAGASGGCHEEGPPAPAADCCQTDKAPAGKEAAPQLPGPSLAVLAVLRGLGTEGTRTIPISPRGREAPARAHGARLLTLLDCYLI